MLHFVRFTSQISWHLPRQGLTKGALMPLYYHPLYTAGIDPSARFPRDRYDMVRDQILQKNAPLELRISPFASREELLLGHDPGFVDRFLGGELADAEKRRIGLSPWMPEIVDRTLALVGGSLAATKYALATQSIAGNMAGGTHHAAYAHGAGYCIINDLAVCANYALQFGLERIAILDLDVHQGDGTAQIFASNTKVFTASVHCEANFPFRKQKSDLDIGLPKGEGDISYLSACREALDACMSTEPQLLLFQAGVDPLVDDALGLLSVSLEGLAQRNVMVFEATRSIVPVVVLMGGGYAKPIERSVEAFVDLFTAAGVEHALRTSSCS